MARGTRRFVYQLPTPELVPSGGYVYTRVVEVAVWFTTDGWLAEARGTRVDERRDLEAIGWVTRYVDTGVRRVLSFPQAVRGDRRYPGFVLDAVRTAQAAGTAGAA